MEFTGFDQNKLSEMIKLASSNVNKFSGKGVSVGGSESKRKEYNTDMTNIPNEPPDNDDCYHINLSLIMMNLKEDFLVIILLVK